MFKINLQLFADLEDIITTNADAFKDCDIKDQFGNISTKLSELGYEVLINNKKQAEFVPSSRLGEVVSQRDTFKTKVEELNSALEKMKEGAGDNQKLKDDYQELINKNDILLKDLEATRINTEIMLAAKDAIDAKDLLVFINMDNISVNNKGEVMGVETEVERLRKEKPYLFGTQQAPRKQLGFDDNNPKDPNKVNGMNLMIRKAAGRL